MQVFRICKDIYGEDLLGTGAKMVGGRWNFKGIAVLYTSQSIALSMLECMAHFPVAFAPKNMVLTTIEIPDDFIEVSLKALPDNWRDVPSPKALKVMGLDWVKDKSALALKVPSTIVANEFNYVINPYHKLFQDIKLLDVKPFDFDKRVL